MNKENTIDIAQIKRVEELKTQTASLNFQDGFSDIIIATGLLFMGLYHFSFKIELPGLGLIFMIVYVISILGLGATRRLLNIKRDTALGTAKLKNLKLRMMLGLVVLMGLMAVAIVMGYSKPMIYFLITVYILAMIAINARVKRYWAYLGWCVIAFGLSYPLSNLKSDIFLHQILTYCTLFALPVLVNGLRVSHSYLKENLKFAKGIEEESDDLG